jgi:hypothetical protein
MIGQRRKEIVARLGAFLRAEIEMLDDYRENSTHDRVPQLPSQMQTPLGGEPAIGGEFEGGGLAERSIAVSAATPDSDPTGGDRPDDYSAYDRFEGGEAEVNSVDVTFGEGHENGSSYDGIADHGQSSGYSEDAEIEVAFEDADDTETVDASEFSEYDVAAELAEERSPVQHQQHQSNDGGFDSSRVVENESSNLGEGEPGDGELTPENTEWRIRRILDNLD